MTHEFSRCRYSRAAAALLALLAAFSIAAAARAESGPAAPIPPGEARLWFYRVFFAGDTLTMPEVAINGRPVGYAVAGTSFYRDVPAGRYVLSVESQGTGLGEPQEIAVAPGQEAYVQIASMPGWEVSARGRSRQATYVVMLMSPRWASLQLPLTRFAGGS